MVRQCVILVGGLGTRLGELTKSVPKPMLPVNGRPFVEILIEEAARFGFDRIVLLAGSLGGQVVEHCAGHRRIAGRDIDVRVILEPEPAGTGGALTFLRDVAEEEFLLMNGDSWFDLDLREFATVEPGTAPFLLRMALRPVADASRFGTVALEDGRVRAFLPRGTAAGGVMNAGIYLVRRALLDRITVKPCSLEGDIFPVLADEGLIEGRERDAFLIDIGVPADYAAAPELLARHRTRPAVFFDRDGVLNHDEGYTHRPDDLVWLPGARETIRQVNRMGWYAFVVTNQGGIARGLYGIKDAEAFHARMSEDLAAMGAHIDEFRLSPYHPEGVVPEFARMSDCRKPNPGMLLDLAAAWPVDMARSLMFGDVQTDMQAAAAAGVRGVLHPDGNLLERLEGALKG